MIMYESHLTQGKCSIYIRYVPSLFFFFLNRALHESTLLDLYLELERNYQEAFMIRNWLPLIGPTSLVWNKCKQGHDQELFLTLEDYASSTLWPQLFLVI